jgi:pimeloyl-ACP methyl ester carboxylesterase
MEKKVKSRPSSRPVFKTADRETEFYAAYDAVLDQWPVAVESVEVPSLYGTTRVHVCGPKDGMPLVLLHGGGATSTVWLANIEELSRTHRIYAVDQIGDPGRSSHDGQRISGLGDLMTWLDALLAHLRLEDVHLGGHSYGGWLALNYALHSPQRVRRLALLDPARCFAGMKLAYLLRALPLVARPTAERQRAFIAWEAGEIPVDPTWLTLVALGTADFPRSKIVIARRPEAGRLQASTVPTLLVLAENSRTHDINRVATNARRLMPHIVTTVLPNTSHHSMPISESAKLNLLLLDFLA